VANKRGYNVIIGLSNESFDKEVINMEMLANGSIDGFIISIAKETLSVQDYHHFKETINQGMPIVMFDRVVDEIECDKVIVDDVIGAKIAVNKLASNGCKNIAIVTTKHYISVGKLRTQGYLEALQENNIKPNPNLILKVDDKFATDDYLDILETEISQLLKNNKEIDGILAVNEIYALTAIKAARKLGRQIPNDIQVIGFTDGVLSRHATPSLTTVSQHGQAMGEKAAELLINKLENENEQIEEQYKTIIIETELVERESTK
jgi:LacI family transcriptional regulator